MNVLLYIRNLKETLNHGLILKKPQKVIRFNQDDRLKPYIEMNNTKLKLMNNAVFGKTMENARKRKEIKLITTERRRNYLVSEPIYHTTKFFYRRSLSN